MDLEHTNDRSLDNRDAVCGSLDQVRLSGVRAQIMQHLRERGPSTREEVALALGKPVHAISGRFTALLKAELIEETDEKRPTKSGHAAVVVRVKQ